MLVQTGCTLIQQSTASEDGRFTIGAGTKRLMYGYPIPRSTSHFVISIDGVYGSNTPYFSADEVVYLHNPVTTIERGGSAHKIVEFEFNGVRITQRLIPVDKNFADVQPGGWGQYYRIEYELENLTDEEKSIGLMLLIDTMIDDNDASQMDADKTRVRSESRFAGSRVPSEVLVYYTPGNRNELSAVLVTDKGRAVKPDELFVGGWPDFHSTVWEPSVSGNPYFDSAILVKWAEQAVGAHQTRYVATHYGLPYEGRVQVLTEGPGMRRVETSVYFDFASDVLTEQAMRSLDELLAGHDITGAFVDVYTDAVGNRDANLKLSKRRAESIIAYLTERGINRDAIVPKSYGEAMADQSAATAEEGKAEDRRADVVIYLQE
jgi:outer membrane protein OmpA-like peptidoglycan-associated protein